MKSTLTTPSTLRRASLLAALRPVLRALHVPGMCVAGMLTAGIGATVGTAHAADTPVQLATKAGCTACHALDKKLIGPSYKDVAARYKGKADAVATISQRIRKGSKDVWGPVPMPPTDATKLGDADLKAVVTWLLKTPA